MKRLNPETGEPFKKGFIRADGSVFFTYCKTVIVASTGFYKEKWLKPDAAEKQLVAIDKSIKAWSKIRNAERRAFLDEIKLSKGCIDCGYNKHPEALDFDHKDGKNKAFDVGARFGTATIERLMAEIEKCEIRCANCHRVKTRKSGEYLKFKKYRLRAGDKGDAMQDIAKAKWYQDRVRKL